MAIHLPLSDLDSPGEPEEPTLNASDIPHAVRHGAIHGALDTRQVGQSMILIAPHNPLPLLKEIAARPEIFAVDYLREGPDDWHLRLTRTT